MTQFPNQLGIPASYGQNPYPGGGAPSEPRRSNTMGLVGFILSLVSIITCGCLSPIALIVSFIGLFKAPRGFALAGTIISVLLVGAWVGVSVGVMAGIKQGGSLVQNLVAMGMAQEGVNKFYAANGRLPDDAEFVTVLDNAVAPISQAFGTQFHLVHRYEQVDATHWRLVLAGRDGQLDTPDDWDEQFGVTGSPPVFSVPPVQQSTPATSP